MTAGSVSARRRDVVVVGGGVMGTSTAYHLARSGITDVTLLESGDLGAGSSGKPLGGVRAVFSEPANIALGKRSLEAFRRFEAEVGVDIGLQQVGYLFAIRDPADVDAFEASVALQNAMGVQSRLVSSAEAVGHCPYLCPDVVAAVWSPDDGFARPGDVVRGYAAAAVAHGVQIRTHTAVVGLEATADGQALVLTPDAAYRTPTVICTAGAWSRQVAAMAGVDLPIEPLRRQVAFAPPRAPHDPRIPFTIDYSTTAYVHGCTGGGLLMGWADPLETPGFGRDVSSDWHDGLRAALKLFVPDIAEVPLAGGWAGLYEMTPDCNAIIGESDAGFRFLYAAGFSGHGFLQAPAVGECVRDLYLGHRPPVDLTAFTLERFTRPSVRTELGII